MNWVIKYTEQARMDIRKIYEYISYVLLVPETAQKQVQRIFKAIRSLGNMPLIHKLYDEVKWGSQGLRALPVDNYMIFYIVKENENAVWIIRVIYGGRNIEKQLNETDI